MEAQVSFSQVVSRGCGIDVHKKLLIGTIRGEVLKSETREFGTFTRSLTELKYWLLETSLPCTGTFPNEGLDCKCPLHQVCAGAQDRQVGQCLDLQITAGRFIKTKLYPCPRATGVA